MASWSIRLALTFAIAIAGAQEVPNLSGTWHLNVQKSSWGKHAKPTSGIVMIEHHEPALKYSGNVDSKTGPRRPSARSTSPSTARSMERNTRLPERPVRKR